MNVETEYVEQIKREEDELEKERGKVEACSRVKVMITTSVFNMR